MPRPLLGIGLLSAALLLPQVAAAQLYRWVDEQGRLHVTDDLSRVPSQLRRRADAESRAAETRPDPATSAASATSPSGTPEQAPGGEPSPAAVEHRDEAPEAPRRHVIPVEQAGLELAVEAQINGRTRAHFKVDTGATINTIPRTLADELGISIDDSTPIAVVSGIGGKPLLVPVVTLQEVRLGSAVVEQVDAAVLDTLGYGLLGMPFFNNFRVQTDPAAGQLTLEEVDLSAVDGIYGGYGESYWRSRFAMIRAQLERVDAYRARIPEEFGELHQRLDAAESYWRGQYDALELRASREGVPRAWRE